jgi:tetratricopeptide (TPR) repeat protein
MNFQRLPSLVLVSLALPFWAACSTQTAVQKSEEFARLGDFGHAYDVVDAERQRQLVENGAVDEELAEIHEMRRRQLLLWRARWAIFQEREDDALRDLATLAEVAPDHPELDTLQKRALVKKATRIVQRADEQLQQKEFASAMEGYLESQRLVKDFELAKEGMGKVRDEMARLDARAQQQFLQAVRKVPEFRFVEVEWHAANVIHNAPDREDAKGLQTTAKRENAKKAFDRAVGCQQDDKFGAALVLYKEARQLDPELEGVGEAIESMTKELEALGMIERAQIEMRNSAHDMARELLGKAYEMSTLSRGTISELMIETRRLEGEERYQKARDLEVLGDKAEALAAFEALAKDWPDGLKDEQARIAGLRTDVEGAATEWGGAPTAAAAG